MPCVGHKVCIFRHNYSVLGLGRALDRYDPHSMAEFGADAQDWGRLARCGEGERPIGESEGLVMKFPILVTMRGENRCSLEPPFPYCIGNDQPPS